MDDHEDAPLERRLVEIEQTTSVEESNVDADGLTENDHLLLQWDNLAIFLTLNTHTTLPVAERCKEELRLAEKLGYTLAEHLLRSSQKG